MVPNLLMLYTVGGALLRGLSAIKGVISLGTILGLVTR
jgi:hypothetical protein